MTDKKPGKRGSLLQRLTRTGSRQDDGSEGASAARPCVELLEARVLYSADPLAVIAGSPDTLSSGDDFEFASAVLAGEVLQPEPALEVVFINDDVGDLTTLTTDLRDQIDAGRNLQVHVLSRELSGVEQISGVLQDSGSIAAIHVVSHGTTDGIHIGGDWLSNDNVQQYQGQLSGWQSSLVSEASLLLYGCDLAAGERGVDLLESLAEHIGAEVFASIDTTGHQSLNADWDLEYQSGDAEQLESLISEAAEALWIETLAAPALGNGTLANIDEDAAVVSGDSIANIFNGQFSGSGNFAGIAIASDPTTSEGEWQYSTDSGSGWFAVGTVNINTALFLDTSSWLRFVPAQDVAGPVPGLTIYGIDDSYSGSFTLDGAAENHDVSTRGGATPFAFASATINSGINAFNDAPVLSDGNLTDTVVNNSWPPGAAIADIFAGQFNDVDAGDALGGVAVVADATVSEGTWEYSTDSGANWYSLGSVSTTSALMLSSSSMMRFVPASDVLGAVPLLTLYGVDLTGSPYTADDSRVTLDVSNRGGATPYAQNSATIVSSVVAGFTVNDDDLGAVVAGNSFNFSASDLTGNDAYQGWQPPIVRDNSLPTFGTLAESGTDYTFGTSAGDSGTATFTYDAMDGSPDIVSQWTLASDGADDFNQNDGIVTSDSPPGLLVFDGNDYVEVPNFSYPSTFTLMFEFQVGDLDHGKEESLYSTGEWEKSNYLGIWINGQDESPGSHLVTEINDSTETGTYSPTTFDVSGLTGWHTYALVVEQGVGHTVYLDGNYVDSSSRADGLFAPSGPAYFGAEEEGSGMGYFLENHGIKNVRLYSGDDQQAIDADVLNKIDTGTVSITVRNEESLDVINNIEVFEDLSVPVTDSFLLTTDVEEGPADLVYTILDDADYGKLELNGTELNVGHTFTQLDINNGNLEFQHGGHETATADTVSLVVDDGAGSTTAVSLTITLKPVNDAPAMANATLAAIAEDSADPSGETIGTLFGGSFSDIDGSMGGVAITANTTSTEGVWQYSTDNGTNWYVIGAVSSSSALVLDTSTRLSFLPATDFFGAVPELTLYGVDDSYSGSYTNGPTTAYAAIPVGGVSSPYTAVSSTLDSFVNPVGPTDLSTGISINADGGNDVYLAADSGGALLGGLSAVTVEVLVSLESLNGTTTLLSYAVPGMSNALMLEVQADGSLIAYVNDQRINVTDSFTVPLDNQPHAVAFSWDSINGDTAFYIDGNLIYSEAGIADGEVLASGGLLVFGQEQDSVGGGFDSTQVVEGTYHDVRLWSEARTEADISQAYRHKFNLDSLPAKLIANWQMDGFDSAGEVEDVVGGSRLSVAHASGAGFSTSTPVDRLTAPEYSANGVVVGTVVPHDHSALDDLVSDGSFLLAGATSRIEYSAGDSIGSGGPWIVDSGNVHLRGAWAQSPLGGVPLELNGSVPGAVSQTLSTEIGESYQVSFALTGHFAELTGKSVQVAAASDTSTFTVLPPADWDSGSALMWNHRAFEFTATSASTVLSFQSMSPASAFGPVIGDVQVVKLPAAVSTMLSSDPSLSYNAGTGKFYKPVADALNWTDSRDAAIAEQLNGVGGQLVTIDSAYENTVVQSLAQGLGTDIWLGASDQASEGSWHWIDGSNQAQQFWEGRWAADGGVAINGEYNNWEVGEPNNSGDENQAKMYAASGEWNDAGAFTTNSYIVEWDEDEVLSGHTFTLLSDNSGGAFDIDELTGVVSVADGGLLDFEVSNTHELLVQVADAAGETYSESITVNVTDVPAPILADIDTGALVYTENDAPLEIAELLGVIDSDDSHLQSAMVKITSGFELGKDVLSLTSGGSVSGTWNAVSGVLTITGPDTVTAWQSALRSVAYHNTSDDPVTGARNIEFQIADDNEVSNTITRTVNVISENDAPSITDITMAPVAEDSNSHGGQRIGDLLSVAMTDIDGSPFGIAIIADATTSEGQWQYSTDNGAMWYPRGSVSETNALVLDNNTSLRFVPSSGFNGAVPDLTVVAIDDSFTGNATVGGVPPVTDVTVRGGSTAFSTGSAAISGEVVSVNDAPVIADTSLPAIAEDTASPVGETVATLFSGVLTDFDDDVLGIAVANDAAGLEGQWKYSTDNGSNWYPVGSVSESSAVLFGLNTRIGFVPASDYFGPVPALEVYGVDSSGGTMVTTGSLKALVDVTSRGGATPYSATSGMLDSVITPVNDAPTIVDVTIDGITEDSTGHSGNRVGDIFSAALLDIDGIATGVAVVSDATGTQGQWQYSTDTPASWIPLGSVSESNALVLGSSAYLRFVPEADYHGVVPPIEVVGIDDTYSGGLTIGTLRAVTDVTARGGMLPFSADIAAIDGTVTSVFDAPVNAGSLPASVDVLEDVVTTIDYSAIVIDAGDDSGELTLRLSTSSGGVLEGRTDAGLTVGSPGGVLEITGYVNALNDYLDSSAVSYVNSTDHVNGVNADSITTTLLYGTNTVLLGVTAVTITPVNDPPQAADSRFTIVEDTPYMLSESDFEFSDPYDGDELQLIEFVTVPVNGQLTFGGAAVSNGDTLTASQVNSGNLMFSPEPDASGSDYDAIKYKVFDNGTLSNDGSNESNSATMVIDVSATNDAPAFVANGNTIQRGAVHVFDISDILAVDPDVTDDQLIITLSSTPVQGEVQLSESTLMAGATFTQSDVNAGNLRYVHSGATSDNDAFALTLKDVGPDATSAVIVKIIGITVTDTHPQAVADSVVVNEHGEIDISVLDNDIAADDPLAVSTVTIIDPPDFGSAVADSTGVVRYVHGGDEVTSDSFIYTVTDQGGEVSDSVVVMITVTPVNDLPVMGGFNGPASQTNEDTTVEITAAQLSSQIDHSDAEDASVQVFEVIGIEAGTLKIGLDAAGATDFAPGNDTIGGGLNAYWTPGSDVNGLVPAFRVSGVDSEGGTSIDSTAVNVEVLPLNDSPLLSALPVFELPYLHRSPAVVLMPLAEITDIDNTQIASTSVRVLNYEPGVDILSSSVPATLNSDWDSATGVLTLSGVADVTDYIEALRSVAYQSDQSPVAVTDSIRQIEVIVTDSDAGLSSAEVVSVNMDIPVYPIVVTSTDTGVLRFIENDDPLLIASVLSVDSIDSQNITGATVEFDNFYGDQDVLSVVDSVAISSSVDTSSGTLTLTGDAPASQWQDVLRSLRYSNSSEDPAAAARHLEITLSSSSGDSNLFVVVVEVIASNDAPGTVSGNIDMNSAVPYVFKVTDFPFSDPAENNDLLSVRIETLPLDGQLLYRESPVASGHEILAAEIADGSLLYIAVPQDESSVVRSLEYRVRDDGGTDAGGVDISQFSATLQLNIAAAEPVSNLEVNNVLPFRVAENQPAGTLVGQLDELPVDPRFSHVAGGGFANAENPLPDFNRYAADNSGHGSSLGDWLVTSGNVDLRGSSWETGPAGGIPLDLNGNIPGAVSQTVTTEPGVEYNLNFVMSGNYINRQSDGKVAVAVEVAAQVANFEFDYFPAWSRDNLQWDEHSVRFVATDTTTTVTFRSLTPDQLGPVITDIELIDVLEYQLLSDNATFAINSSNHVVVGSQSPDYETRQTHMLEVLALNTAGHSEQLIIPVDVLDRNEPPVLEMNEPLRSIVGVPSIIGAEHLHALDIDEADSAANELNYTVTQTPVAGALTLSGSPLSSGAGFTQQDINLGLLSYLPEAPGVVADSFSVTVADGGENGVAPVAGQLEIQIRKPLAFDVPDEWLMLEGGTLALSASLVSRTGGYIDDGDLIVEAGNLSEGFEVINTLSNFSVSSFTVEELVNGEILLRHDGGERHVSDITLNIFKNVSGTRALLESHSARVIAADVADAPFAANVSMTTDHISPVTISDDLLAFNDGEDGDELTGLEIVAVPTEGTVTLAGAATAAGDFVPVQALKDNQLQYLPDRDARGTEVHTLRYRAVDSGITDNGGSNFSNEVYAIEFTVVSDHAPVASPDKVVVSEGGTVSSLASGDISVSENDIDFDTDTMELLVELTGPPLHGSLQLNADGTFVYIHDGSETRSDSFSYRVVDSQSELGTLLGSIGFVEIEVTPENDAPVAGAIENVITAVNQPLEISLPDNLFTDVDSGDQLTYQATLANGSPLPDWLSINEQTGELNGVAESLSVGTLQIVLSATDSTGESAQAEFALTVEPQFDAALPEVAPSFVEIDMPSTLPAMAQVPGNQVVENALNETAGTSASVNSSLGSLTATEDTALIDEPIRFAFENNLRPAYNNTFNDTVHQHNRLRSSASFDASQQLEATVLPTDTVLELQQLFFIPTDNPSSVAKKIQQNLNQIRDEVSTSAARGELVIGGAISLSAGFSIGYVIWIIRGGVLLSSVLASMPAWRLIDPIPVLTEQDNDDEEDSETLQSIVEERRKSEAPDDRDDALKSEVNAQHNGGNVG